VIDPLTSEPKCKTKDVERCASLFSLLELVYDMESEKYDTNISQDEYNKKIHAAKGDDQLFTTFDYVDMTRVLGGIKTDPEGTKGMPEQINFSNFLNKELNPDSRDIGYNEITSAEAT